jgi:hypothetical protein
VLNSDYLGELPLDEVLDFAFLAYDLATGAGAATIITDIAALVIPYVPVEGLRPIVAPVLREIDGELRPVQILDKAPMAAVKFIEKNPIGKTPKATIRLEYKGLNSHPMGQNYGKHFKYVNKPEAEGLAYTRNHPDESQWKSGTTDDVVKGLIDKALKSYVAQHPKGDFESLRGFEYDFYIGHTHDPVINAASDALSTVGYSNGKCTTKIKLSVDLNGYIHAYPIPK